MTVNMLRTVKTALRITTDAFDLELVGLIDAAIADLAIAGVNLADAGIEPEEVPIVARAICTYCKLNFGEPDNWDILKKAYDEQKAQLAMSQTYNGRGQNG